MGGGACSRSKAWHTLHAPSEPQSRTFYKLHSLRPVSYSLGREPNSPRSFRPCLRRGRILKRTCFAVEAPEQFVPRARSVRCAFGAPGRIRFYSRLSVSLFLFLPLSLSPASAIHILWAWGCACACVRVWVSPCGSESKQVAAAPAKCFIPCYCCVDTAEILKVSCTGREGRGETHRGRERER